MDIFKSSFAAMGGSAEFTFPAASESAASNLARAAIAEVHRIEQKYSRYNPASLISQINQQAGNEIWITCDTETCELLDLADQLYEVSGGLFDITSGILRQAWDFSQPRLPDEELLTQLRARIGWRRVERDKERIRLPETLMEIDFGGFGKEYAADRAALVLARQGIKHGYVNLGGDIRVIGPQPDGSPWTVGIQDPRQPHKLAASIPLSSGALATSGDYERYFELGGKRYCHILDPRTGYPVSFWRSVTVLAPEAIVAGAHTTLALLMADQGLGFLRNSGVRFLGIDHNGNFHQH
jgi:FAD:protein FMN transferase